MINNGVKNSVFNQWLCSTLLILSASGGFSLERVNDTQEF